MVVKVRNQCEPTDKVYVEQTGKGIEVTEYVQWDLPDDFNKVNTIREEAYGEQFAAGQSLSEGVAGRAPFCRDRDEARESGVPGFQDQPGGGCIEELK